MRFTTLLLTFLGCLFSFQSMLSQRFPINVNVQAIPPSPINFSEYANPNTLNSPLRVQLLLNDLTISNRQIKLKASFEGGGIRFESATQTIGGPPIFIDGGVPLTLSNVELAPLFEFQNIVGISPEV